MFRNSLVIKKRTPSLIKANMYIVNHRTIFFTITGIILVAAIASIFIYGLPLSIDFTGGSLIQVTYTQPRPSATTLENALAPLKLGGVRL